MSLKFAGRNRLRRPVQPQPSVAAGSPGGPHRFLALLAACFLVGAPAMAVAEFRTVDAGSLTPGDCSRKSPRVRVRTLIIDKGEGWLVQVTDSSLVAWIDRNDLVRWRFPELWDRVERPFPMGRDSWFVISIGTPEYAHWHARGWVEIPRGQVTRLQVDRDRTRDLSYEWSQRQESLQSERGPRPVSVSSLAPPGEDSKIGQPGRVATHSLLLGVAGVGLLFALIAAR